MSIHVPLLISMGKSGRYIIGIAGGSASGKTSILNDLLSSPWKDSLALVSQDNYYIDRENQFVDENGIINFDLPTAIDNDHFYADVQALERGESITKTEYTFNNDAVKPKEITIHSAPIIIVEGLFIFHFERIKSEMDYKVFVDAESEVRLQRRIDRDLTERGYPESDVRYRWKNHVQPADELYLQPYKAECDLIIDSTESYHRDFLALENHIKALLENEKSISPR